MMTPEERRQLELNLVAEGCRDALVVWNGSGAARSSVVRFRFSTCVQSLGLASRPWYDSLDADRTNPCSFDCGKRQVEPSYRGSSRANQAPWKTAEESANRCVSRPS